MIVTVAAASSAFALAHRRSRRLALVVTLAIATGVAGLPPALQALVGCVLSSIAVEGAWRVAGEHRSEARIWTRPTASAVVALVTVHLLRLVRVERLRLTFATMLHGVGAAGLLTLRSEPLHRSFGRALAIMTVPLVLGASLFVAPLVDCERAMIARLRALRVRRWAIVSAFLLAIALPTSAFAATAGVGAGVAADLSPASLGGALGSWAVLLSVVVGAWGRYHDRTKARSSGLFAVGVAVIALTTVTFAMALP